MVSGVIGIIFLNLLLPEAEGCESNVSLATENTLGCLDPIL